MNCHHDRYRGGEADLNEYFLFVCMMLTILKTIQVYELVLATLLTELVNFTAVFCLSQSTNRLFSLQGERLNYAVMNSEIQVTIGNRSCPINDLSATKISCNLPKTRPPGLDNDGRPDWDTTPVALVNRFLALSSQTVKRTPVPVAHITNHYLLLLLCFVFLFS